MPRHTVQPLVLLLRITLLSRALGRSVDLQFRVGPFQRPTTTTTCWCVGPERMWPPVLSSPLPQRPYGPPSWLFGALPAPRQIPVQPWAWLMHMAPVRGHASSGDFGWVRRTPKVLQPDLRGTHAMAPRSTQCLTTLPLRSLTNLETIEPDHPRECTAPLKDPSGMQVPIESSILWLLVA